MLAYARRRKGAAAVAALIALFLVVVPLLKRGEPAQLRGGGGDAGAWRWLTVVDAGSSGCRAHVFRWRADAHKHVEVDPTHNNLKVKPGLSSFAASPEAAGASLKPLVDFVLSEIPEDAWASSPIYLKATAGLRMIDAGPRERILESVRDALAASPLSFDDREAGAKVIAGVDEGGFGWMSVNYLMGHLDGSASPGDYVGVVEMGGASAQVTQVAAGSTPKGYGFDFRMGANHYALYTHSYLGYGLEQARETLSHELVKKGGGRVKDPCLNAGFAKTAAEKRDDVYDGPDAVDLRGVGTDAHECRRAVERALFDNAEDCDFGSCSFNGVYQPTALPAGNLLAFENFFYTASLIGMPMPDSSVAAFHDAAADVCGRTWADLEAAGYPKDGSDAVERNKLCFSATYLALFLEKGLGVAPSKKLNVMQQVGDHGIDWSLGAAIKEASIISHSED